MRSLITTTLLALATVFATEAQAQVGRRGMMGGSHMGTYGCAGTMSVNLYVAYSMGQYRNNAMYGYAGTYYGYRRHPGWNSSIYGRHGQPWGASRYGPLAGFSRLATYQGTSYSSTSGWVYNYMMPNMSLSGYSPYFGNWSFTAAGASYSIPVGYSGRYVPAGYLFP